ncbi:hypothetical protein ES703_14179 [subsurface metagenome]
MPAKLGVISVAAGVGIQNMLSASRGEFAGQRFGHSSPFEFGYLLVKDVHLSGGFHVKQVQGLFSFRLVVG